MGNGSSERRPVAKAMQLLSWMVDAPEQRWGVRELARGMGLPPATVHRLLTSLLEEGFVGFDGDAMQYELGPEFYRIALKLADGINMTYIARPLIEELAATWDETSFVTTYDSRRRRAMFTASVDSSHELRYVVPLFEWMPLPYAASGLAILAFLDQDEARDVIAEVRDEWAVKKTILARELEAVREDGYAMTVGRRVPGAVGISAPIFSHAGRVVGGVGLSVPEQRFAELESVDLTQSVMQCAAEITRQLGGAFASSI